MARNKIEVDEELESGFDLNQLKRLTKYIKPYKGKMVAAILIMLVSSALSMLIPIFLKNIMDDYIPNRDRQAILLTGMATLLIAFIIAGSLKAKILLTSSVGQDVIYELRKDLFIHLQKLPFSYYDNRPHGKIQVRVVNYVNHLSDLLSNGIVNTITDLMSLVFIVFFMLRLNIQLALICFCGIPVLAVVIWTVKRKQRRAWQIESNKQSNLNAYIAESLNGIRVTQSFVREERNTTIFNRLSGEYRTAWMNAVKYNFMLSPIVDTISVVTTSFIYVFGIYWMMGGNASVTPGVLIAFTGYISRFWQPITTLAGFYNSLLTSISYLERIFETIDEPVLVTDEPGAKEMPLIRGEVEFQKVDFSYEDGIKRLDQVSFHVKAGETYAIVGPTGAGKTTIINLISRFYNLDSGQILIDGIDIRTVTIASLRKQMGVMLQDSFIFSGTIMDNIRYGNRDATDEEVIRAAKTVCAHSFIMQMENGYQTEVNERGSRLSQGQRQLISFARALLADPKILILDEATSSIDTETEIVLQKGLAELLKGRTSFIIAHRLSTIQAADCILYVDQGRIVEMGNHMQLLRQKGEYYQLYMAQYSFLAS